MNLDKTTKIKEIVAKINPAGINAYSQEYPESKTLKRIVNCRQRVLNSNDSQETFKLGTDLAYYLDWIVNKNNYVKNEAEKKHWLEISKELFENTIRVKVK